jgi:uncharacterized integral membrane protein
VRFLFGFVMAPVTVAIVLFAVSNRAPLTLRLWPLPFAVDLPVYVLALGALLVGFLIGAFAAWAAASRWRRRAREQARRAAALERELSERRPAAPPSPAASPSAAPSALTDAYAPHP